MLIIFVKGSLIMVFIDFGIAYSLINYGTVFISVYLETHLSFSFEHTLLDLIDHPSVLKKGKKKNNQTCYYYFSVSVFFTQFLTP